MSTFLRLPAVIARTGLSRSSIYNKVADGSFPPPVHISTRAIGFVSDEIEAWISERIAFSRPPTSSA